MTASTPSPFVRASHCLAHGSHLRVQEPFVEGYAGGVRARPRLVDAAAKHDRLVAVLPMLILLLLPKKKKKKKRKKEKKTPKKENATYFSKPLFLPLPFFFLASCLLLLSPVHQNFPFSFFFHFFFFLRKPRSECRILTSWWWGRSWLGAARHRRGRSPRAACQRRGATPATEGACSSAPGRPRPTRTFAERK